LKTPSAFKKVQRLRDWAALVLADDGPVRIEAILITPRKPLARGWAFSARVGPSSRSLQQWINVGRAHR